MSATARTHSSLPRLCRLALFSWILRNKTKNSTPTSSFSFHINPPNSQIAIAFSVVLTLAAFVAAALARAHARSAKEGWKASAAATTAATSMAATATTTSATPPRPPSHLSRAAAGNNATAGLARRRLVGACFATILSAAAFSVVASCACASGWAVGHMVQLGIESTASGDNRDFANAVGEALAQAQTKLARRMEGATDEAYSTVVNGALGDIREF